MSSISMGKFPILGGLDQTVKATIRKIYVFINHGENAFFITKNDDVYAVGSNRDYCLGIGKDGECNKARKITPLCKKEILDISYGGHLLALSADGSVYSWGYNDEGQLGNGTTNHGPSPALVKNIQHKKIVQVACGGGHSLALSDDGEIYAWGCNDFGQIGSDTERHQLVPLKVTSQIGTRRAISIACGAVHSVALLDNGEVYTWGHNGYGQLGLGNNDYRQSIPCKVEALSGEVITQIVCGWNYTMVLTQKGSIYSWGENGHGQLGTGDRTSYNHPKQILIDERFLQIAADQYDESLCISAGLTYTGRVYIPDEPFTWRLCSVDGETLSQNNLSKQASFEVKKQAGKDCTKWDEQYKELNLKPHDFTKENKRLNLTEQTDPIKDLVEDLSKAFDDSTTGDIKFNTPDGVIFCHKAILLIRCAYLKSRFEDELGGETKDTIKVPYTYSIYRAFLYFLYTGTISLELKGCIGLLALSNTYGEDGLKQQCENILKCGIAVENSVQLYSAALESDAKELEDHCFNFIVDHMPDVVETEDFSHLDKTTKAIMMKVHQKATSK